MGIATINPATGELVREFAALNDAEIDRRIARAVEAFRLNRTRSFSERAKRMQRAADL